jgi:hypothetical protein
MERAELDRLEQQVSEEVDTRFPGVAQRVEVLQYGDEPVIEPGELMVRVTLEAGEGQDARDQALKDFEHAHGAAVKHFRHDLSAQLPEVGRLEFRSSGDDGHSLRMMLGGGPRGLLKERAAGRGAELTPVMARLGPEDLETLDALITAGIASSRAEAVRWVLARIRERPAYAQLRERAAEIERLKTEF